MPVRSHRALALDFGRVLTLEPDQSSYAFLRQRFDIPEAAFSQAWNAHRHEYDRGTINTATYWTQILNSCLPDPAKVDLLPLIEEMADADFASWNQPRETLHRIVQDALDAKVPAAIVSNMPEGLGDRFVRAWPWLSRIQYRFFSAEIGLVKPDDAFYHHVLEQTGWSPRSVLFVDDLPANIQTAARLGFETLLFTGSESDVDQIRSWCRS